jgi:cytochrome P450
VFISSLIKTNLPRLTYFYASRPEPHRRLKKFLSPAFTVAYIDKLEVLFEQCVRDLLQKYQAAIDEAKAKPGDVKRPAIESDFMEDLHNVALDM